VTKPKASPEPTAGTVLVAEAASQSAFPRTSTLLDTPDHTTKDTIYSVSQVSALIKGYLEASPVLADLTVSGEVSNCRKPSSGHHYFTLRDAESALSCVMFRYGRGGEFISDGAQVIAHGKVSIYTARGDMQLYVDTVRPDGVGALQLAFEELRKRLDSEGLFDPSRKRALPTFPVKIAVITSPSGAVIQDIRHVLSRRYPLAELLLVPTSVQGESAAPEIVQAISTMNAMDDIDVAIVARGGGSLEDLWPFNEEIVARSIYGCKVPIISAVGHETDYTIADFVADLRAPTPSAAAEIVVPDVYDLARDVAGFTVLLLQGAQRLVRDRRVELEFLMDRMEYRSPDTVTPRRRVEDLMARAKLAASRIVEFRRQDVRRLEAQLSALGPGEILARGYSIVRLKDGPVAASVSDVSTGDSLEIMLPDGQVDAEATAVRPGTASSGIKPSI
jgi:exodeoxyribonuclease VII large subunit